MQHFSAILPFCIAWRNHLQFLTYKDNWVQGLLWTYVRASEPDPTLFKTSYLSLPQNHLNKNGQKLVFLNGSENMFNTHAAHYISSLKQRKVMRNHICNKYARNILLWKIQMECHFKCEVWNVLISLNNIFATVVRQESV